MSGATTNTRTSFQQRKISVTFTLGLTYDTNGVVSATAKTIDGISNTVTFDGPRVSARIVYAGGPSQGALDLELYGLSASYMNQLQVIGPPYVVGNPANLVSVSAGSDQDGMSLVYVGYVYSAEAGYDGAPNVPFRVRCLTAYQAAIMNFPHSSYPGTADAAVIMGSIARKLGWAFENNNVQVKLSNPYFWGSALDQIEDCADQARIEFFIDGVGAATGQNSIFRLAIWPRGTARTTASIPLISPETGLVRYPRRTGVGVDLTTLFNPLLSFGSKVEVKSSLLTCCGIWKVAGMEHIIESETVNGDWFTNLVLVTPTLLGGA